MKANHGESFRMFHGVLLQHANATSFRAARRPRPCRSASVPREGNGRLRPTNPMRPFNGELAFFYRLTGGLEIPSLGVQMTEIRRQARKVFVFCE
jgi:hypothetical protein